MVTETHLFFPLSHCAASPRATGCGSRPCASIRSSPRTACRPIGTWCTWAAAPWAARADHGRGHGGRTARPDQRPGPGPVERCSGRSVRADRPLSWLSTARCRRSSLPTRDARRACPGAIGPSPSPSRRRWLPPQATTDDDHRAVVASVSAAAGRAPAAGFQARRDPRGPRLSAARVPLARQQPAARMPTAAASRTGSACCWKS